MIWFLIFILFSFPVYANTVGGVDFSTFGKDMAMSQDEERTFDYFIPRFNHPDQARVWAHKVKYIPALYKRVGIKKDNTRTMVILNQNPDTPEEATRLLRFMVKYDCLSLAHKIMTEYKDKGIYGSDDAMTSEYEVPHFKNKKYSVAYARAIGVNESIRLAFEKRAKELRHQAFLNERATTLEGLIDQARPLIEEYRIIRAALDVMNKAKAVGAVVRMSSEPVEYTCVRE